VSSDSFGSAGNALERYDSAVRLFEASGQAGQVGRTLLAIEGVFQKISGRTRGDREVCGRCG